RLLKAATINAEAGNLVATKIMDLLEWYLQGRNQQAVVDTHVMDVAPQLIINFRRLGFCTRRLGILSYAFHLTVAGGNADHSAGVDAQARAWRHVPELGADQRIDARGVATCVHRPQLGCKLAAGLLQAPAGIL